MPPGTKAGLGPGHIVLDGDPAPPWKVAEQLPTFRPTSIVAKRLPISFSATAELSSYTGMTDELLMKLLRQVGKCRSNKVRSGQQRTSITAVLLQQHTRH